MIIGPVQEHERQVPLRLVMTTGLFAPEEAESLLGEVLDSLAAGELPGGHTAVACREPHDGPAIGWSYYAPDPFAEKVWNVWWIGVSPNRHGEGAGQAILTHVEQAVVALSARVIVVETSDQVPLARARSFYLKQGYEERGRIPDLYAKGNSKVIYSRSIAGAA